MSINDIKIIALVPTLTGIVFKSSMEILTVFFAGYKYYEDDMVAICRLRNNTLKRFEVCMDDIIFSNQLAKLDPLKASKPLLHDCY